MQHPLGPFKTQYINDKSQVDFRTTTQADQPKILMNENESSFDVAASLSLSVMAVASPKWNCSRRGHSFCCDAEKPGSDYVPDVDLEPSTFMLRSLNGESWLCDDHVAAENFCRKRP
jgi:hypothetical protein